MSEKTIGIIGGGQLGRMLTLAAKSLGFRVLVVDPSPNCPASQVGAEEITAGLYDTDALLELADRSDYITIEIEHIDVDVLKRISASGKAVNPLPQTVEIIQDKLWQKQLLQKGGVPIAPFRSIDSPKDIKKALDDWPEGIMIKSRKGGYDGHSFAGRNTD